MTTYERLAEIETTLEPETAKETYNKREAVLAELLGSCALGAEVSNKDYGPGHIVAFKGADIDNIIIDVEYADCIKKYSLPYILSLIKTIKFEDAFEIRDIWAEVNAKHKALANNLKTINRQIAQAEADAKKKAEEEKRAEAKYQAAKAKAIADFKAWIASDRPMSASDEFYYALGWLAKHAGTVSAALPDYLADDFKTYFGPDTPCRIVDSKKRGPAGWQSQWAKSCSVSLKKPDVIPNIFTKYLNPKGTAITDTDFVLDLVDDYGFQFGKTQDIEKIRACVPTAHIEFFENGLI